MSIAGSVFVYPGKERSVPESTTMELTSLRYPSCSTGFFEIVIVLVNVALPVPARRYIRPRRSVVEIWLTNLVHLLACAPAPFLSMSQCRVYRLQHALSKRNEYASATSIPCIVRVSGRSLKPSRTTCGGRNGPAMVTDVKLRGLEAVALADRLS